MKLKVDLHVHSDGSEDGRDSVERLLERAEKLGLAAIAVCDHNRCFVQEGSDSAAARGGVLLIRGSEVSTDSGHILGLFLERPIDFASLCRDGLPTGEAAIGEIHRCGGVAVLAHPFERAGADVGALSALASCGLDLIESANSRAPMKIHDANERAAALAAGMGLGKVGGSDAHSAAELGGCYTVVETDELTVRGIKSSLLAGRCEPVFCDECSWRRKALSQWTKAKRRGRARGIIKAFVYLAVSPLRDIVRAVQLKREETTKCHSQQKP